MAQRSVAVLEGNTMRGLQALAEAVRLFGGTEYDLDLLSTEEGEILRWNLAKLIVHAGRTARSFFPVVVDYGQSVQQMIALGKYDIVDSRINPETMVFDGRGVVKVDVFLASFGSLAQYTRDMSSPGVIRALEEEGLSPARIEHLLALGATHPKEQCESPIVALGNLCSVGGEYLVPCIGEKREYVTGDYERYLRLVSYDTTWSDSWRFAALRVRLVRGLLKLDESHYQVVA
jgi:hypothetical protein